MKLPGKKQKLALGKVHRREFNLRTNNYFDNLLSLIIKH